MKHFLLFFFATNLFFPQVVFADSKLEEIDNYNEIMDLVVAETKIYSQDELLLVFDIDHTLVILQDCLTQAQKDKLKGLSEFKVRVDECEADITEDKVLELTETMQDKKYPVMAMTARSAPMMERTFHHLESNGLTFPTAPGYDENDLDKQETVEFCQKSKAKKKPHYVDCTTDSGDKGYIKTAVSKKGVYYVNGANKGLALQAFLQEKSLDYKRIIFIDDNQRYVKQINAAYENFPGVDMLVINYPKKDSH